MLTRRNLEVPAFAPGADVDSRLAALERAYRSLLDALVADRIALNQPGAVDIADAVINATNGIKFQATQNAITDVNTLDDYEEGATAPAPASGTGTLTTAAATVRYTKIGDRCFFNVVVAITTNGTGATNITVTMPFTAAEQVGVGGHKTGGIALAGSLSGTTLTITLYDGTYPGADATNLRMTGHFRV